jgi:molecular chaperone Hsp33
MPNSTPYSSTIKMDEQNSDQIINQVLMESYQTNSSIEMGREFESIMITRLPKAAIDSKYDSGDERTLLDYTLEESRFLNNSFSIAQKHDEQKLIKQFEENGFIYLSGRDVQFHCPCSKERMVSNLFSLKQEDRDDLFNSNDSITTRCDYCNSNYEIFKADLLN